MMSCFMGTIVKATDIIDYKSLFSRLNSKKNKQINKLVLGKSKKN